MNAFQTDFVETLSLNLFGLLLGLLLVSTVVGLLALLVIRFSRHRSAADRFNICKLAMVALLAAPIVVALVPEVHLGWTNHWVADLASPAAPADPDSVELDSEVTSRDSIARIEKSRPLFPADEGSFEFDVTQLQREDSGAKRESEIKEESELATSGPPVLGVDDRPNDKTNASISQSPATNESTTKVESQTPFRWLFNGPGRDWLASMRVIVILVWFSIALLMLVRIVYSTRRTMAISRRASEGSGNSSRWADSPAPILVTDELAIPVTVGVVKPKVLLPREISRWPKAPLRLIVKHEQAHVIRRDVFWQIFSAVVKSLYWFQPLVWAIGRSMKLEREIACDDAVIGQGERPSDYATVLLQVAADLSGKYPRLVGAIPVAVKPIEYRLKKILEPLTPRVSAPGFRLFLTVAFGLLTVGLCSLRPFQQPLPSIPESTQEVKEEEQPTDLERTYLPSKIIGRVLDHDKNPVAGAEVEMTFYGRGGKGSSQLATATRIDLTARTDESGRYEIGTEGKSVPGDGYSGAGFVKAKGHPRAMIPYIPVPLDNRLEMPETRFSPSRRIIGRVVSEGDNPATHANVRFGRVFVPGINPGFQEQEPLFMGEVVHCDSQGRFETWVPRTGTITMSAIADDRAGIQMVVPGDRDDLGDIKLPLGTTLSGRLRDDDNEPIAGVIVNIAQCEPLNFENNEKDTLQRLLYHSVKTDELGSYQLPPFRGKCQVWVSGGGNNRDGSILSGDRMPPVVLPRILELSEPGSQDLNFQPCETVTVSGKIVWNDGTAVENLDVRANLLVEGGTAIPINQCLTDSKGTYELQVPKGAKQLNIMVSGAKHPETGKYLYAHMNGTYAKKSRAGQIHLENIQGDIKDANWKLYSERPGVARPAAVVAAQIGEKDFESLVKRYFQMKEEYEARIKNVEGEEEFFETQNEYSPNQQLVDEFLLLEQKHRGTSLGANILSVILEFDEYQDTTVPDSPHDLSDSKLARGRRVAIQRIEQHYLQFEEADRFLEPMNFLSIVEPAAKELLGQLQTESPHTRVRAAALTMECEMKGAALRAHELIQNDGTNTSAWPPNLLEFILELDVEATRARFNELADRIMGAYADVEIRRWTANLSRSLLRTERPAGGLYSTYAEMAAAKKFQVERLAIGKKVPEIGGDDGFGNLFMLGDLIGKVVVVYFTSPSFSENDICNLLEKSRQQKEKFGDQPFEILSIFCDSKLEDAKRTIEAEDISWQTLWDGHLGPIARRWNVRSIPSGSWLIDQNGVIVGRFDHDIDFTDQIEELLKR